MGSPKKTIAYRFDSVGNRVGMTDPDGGRFTYAYDAVNRITHLENPQGERTTYGYDAAGRRSVKKLANGTRASFTYDAAGNLTTLANLKSDNTVISSFDYKYDRMGNRTSVVEADGSRVTWTYDATYQLTSEHRTGSHPYEDSYTYDAAGNRLLKIHDGARTTSSYDAANQIRWSEDASGRTTYTFDANGNQKVVEAPNGDRTTNTWDGENRMTSVQQPDGTRNTMTYEPGGLRVKIEESTGTKKFVWDDQNYLAETDENDDTQVVYTNEPRVYGNLVSQRRGADSHWYHFDATRSTRQVTDTGGTSIADLLFTAYGMRLTSPPIVGIALQFGGEEGYFTDPTDVAYVRRRSFLPGLGRWTSTDPLFGLGSQIHNAYSYVNNRPTAYSDPSGLSPCCGVDVGPHLFTGMDFLRDGFARLPDEEKIDVCESMYNFGGWDIKPFWHAGGGGLPRQNFWFTDVRRLLTSTTGYVNHFESPPCGTGRCAGTVTINGECYWASEANYYLWGTANRMCMDWMETNCELVELIPYPLEVAWGLSGNIAYWKCGDRITWFLWTMKDAMSALTFGRMRYIGRLLPESDDPFRRPGEGMGLDCRIAWTAAGYYDDLASATGCAVSDECAPCLTVYSAAAPPGPEYMLVYIGKHPVQLIVELTDDDVRAGSYGESYEDKRRFPPGCCSGANAIGFGAPFFMDQVLPW